MLSSSFSLGNQSLTRFFRLHRAHGDVTVSVSRDGVTPPVPGNLWWWYASDIALNGDIGSLPYCHVTAGELRVDLSRHCDNHEQALKFHNHVCVCGNVKWLLQTCDMAARGTKIFTLNCKTIIIITSRIRAHAFKVC